MCMRWALSLCTWLRNYMTALFKSIGAFMTRLKKIYMRVSVEVKDSGIQASQWLDAHACARCTERIQSLEYECFSKERYIDELEAQVDRMRESLEDFLREREIAEKRSTKLEDRMHQL